MSALTFVIDVPERRIANWDRQEGRYVRALAAVALQEFDALTTQMKTTVQCPLTIREQQVLERIARGKQMAAIAHDLQLSEKTVAYHSARVRRRLGVKTSAEAVSIAALNEWLQV